MLVLTRKVGEKILIGDDITITVVDIGQSRLKVGIEAPAGHRILRSELVVDVEPASPSSEAGMLALADGDRPGTAVPTAAASPGRPSRSAAESARRSGIAEDAPSVRASLFPPAHRLRMLERSRGPGLAGAGVGDLSRISAASPAAWIRSTHSRRIPP